MSSDVQSIRRSQFVTTYGPGAIIESKNGPRIIPTLNHGLGFLFSTQIFDNYTIIDSRFITALNNQMNKRTKIIALPSNASEGKAETQGIYRTFIFPVWSICYGREGKHRPILFNRQQNDVCPICNTSIDVSAVRFVSACIDGHLDEVYWNYAIHYGKERNCNPKYFWWNAGGSALADIRITCPNCNTIATMEDIYALDFKCTGRHPEKENPIYRNKSPFLTFPKRPYKRGYVCEEKMKVIQRQSTSLRMSETMTLLTIPEYDKNISRIMQREKISDKLSTIKNSPIYDQLSEKQLLDWIKKDLIEVVEDATIDEIIKYIKENGIGEYKKLFDDLHRADRNYGDFYYEEFDSLLAGPRNSPNYKMGSKTTHKISFNNYDVELDIFPIYKIRTVTAQIGYVRQPYQKKDQKPKIIDSSCYLEGIDWYPGYEGIGEGIFLTFNNNNIPPVEKFPAYKEWIGNKDAFLGYQDDFFKDVIQKPLFVWLHTLSHSLIKSISLTSGYSSASLNERVYINREANNGGILIYITSPGEDGGMGGLVGSLRNFSNILDKAKNEIFYCSNDPLCFEVRKNENRVNGSICYSCLFLSETSCNHRNAGLDRHMVVGD